MLCLCRTLLLDPQRAVIITMVTVRMMQVAFYQVVDMVPMGRPLMAALGTMNMPFLVASAVVVSCASVGIRCVHFEHVLIHMVPVHMVQVPVMQVVGVPVMADGLVPAVRPVLVRVVSMRLAFVHRDSPQMQRPVSSAHGIAFEARLKTVLLRNASSDAKPQRGNSTLSSSVARQSARRVVSAREMAPGRRPTRKGKEGQDTAQRRNPQGASIDKSDPAAWYSG